MPIEKIRALRGVMPSGSKGYLSLRQGFQRRQRFLEKRALLRGMVCIMLDKPLGECFLMVK